MEKTNNWKRLGVVKVLNVGWKVSLVVMGVFTLYLIGSAVWEWKNDRYGDDVHFWDRNLSENICVHFFRRGDVRVYDRKAEKYVTPRLEWVASTPDSDSLTVFCGKDGKTERVRAKAALPVDETTPVLRDVTISDVTVR